jgi:hypothetical protein
MATSAQISMKQYLHSAFEPDAEFVNGEIEERNVGEYDHNAVQKAILLWFDQHDKESWPGDLISTKKPNTFAQTCLSSHAFPLQFDGGAYILEPTTTCSTSKTENASSNES